jgi:hypothetical protein
LARDEIPEFSYAARRGQPVLDPAMRRMAFLAGGISLVVIVVALAWSGMKPGIGFGPPPVILAPAGPLRVAPDDPGGLTVPEADEQIMSGDDGGGVAQLAPQAAAPAIAQLSAAAGLQQAAPFAPAAAAAAEQGDVQVQLAAAADEAGAMRVWAGLAAKMPAAFGDRQPEILPDVVNGNSVWRLRLGGFADVDAAKAFCAKLVAKGAVCTVPSP